MARRFRSSRRKLAKSMGYSVPRLPKAKQIVDGKKTTFLQRAAKYGPGVIPALVTTVMGMAKMINAEEKIIDTDTTVTPNASVGSSQYLTGVSTGDDETNRDGRKILLKDILSRIWIRKNPSASDSLVRLALVCDKENDGTTPAWTDVFQSAGALSPLNRDNSKRFAIIKNFQLRVNNDTPSQNLKVYRKLQFHTLYDGTGATIADAKQNQLFWMSLSTEVSDLPSVTTNTRIKFYDN